MRFYKQQHQFYCGIDLHARKMYVCVIDQKCKTRLHKNMPTEAEMFFELIFPFLEDIVIGVECVFCWYWIADLCAQHSVPFVLGHALYMKAIHGGKTKNDKIDSFKIAALLRGGNFPLAYTYPAPMRATRDLLRRRMYLSRRCGELVAHRRNMGPMFLCDFSLNLSKAIGGNDGIALIHTMIYTYILQQGGEGVPSPLDFVLVPHERGSPGGDEDAGWNRDGRGRTTVLAFCMTPPCGAPLAESRMVNGSEREKHAQAIMTV